MTREEWYEAYHRVRFNFLTYKCLFMSPGVYETVSRPPETVYGIAFRTTCHVRLSRKFKSPTVLERLINYRVMGALFCRPEWKSYVRYRLGVGELYHPIKGKLP